MQNIFGLKRRKGYVLSRFVRGIVILGTGVYIISVILSFYCILNKGDNDMHFTNEVRTVIMSMLFTPVILSFAVACFYERLHPKHSLNYKLIGTIFLLQVCLFMPGLLFLFRYSNWIEILFIVSAVVTIIIQFIPISSAEQKEQFYKKIQFIYWTIWSPECMTDIDNNHFRTRKAKEKEHIYTDADAVKVFQEYFVPYSREAELIKQYWDSKFDFSTNNLTMLDIGGYDGKFTIKLLKELDFSINSIEVVEPINQENAYRQNLSPKCANIHFRDTIGFETYSTTSTFDFILASHSLYSCIDNNKYNIEALINRLLSYLNKNGLIIVILGNSKGRAYSLKKELKKLIVNEETQDANSCDFEEELKKQSGIDYKKISIDNYIEIETILRNEQALKDWVSYFARVPIIKEKHILEGVKDLFDVFSVKHSNLPEETKKIYKIEENTLLLPHKTDAFLIKKT